MTNANQLAIETMKSLRDSMPRNAQGDRAAVILGSAILHLDMEVTHMVIEYDEYTEARKVLRGGTAPVVAHVINGSDADWGRVVEVKAIHGGFLGRFFTNPDRWTRIDGLEVRK